MDKITNGEWNPLSLGKGRTGAIVIAAIVLVGVVLRFWLFFHRPYLWLDEAHLAPNVLWRDWSTLFSPAENEQMAPFGYLALVKASTLAIRGQMEWGLRFPSLLSGIANLLLVIAVVQKIRLPATTQIFAIFLAALLSPWIAYSVEFKQYSVELTVALISTLLALYALEEAGFRWRVALILFGFVATVCALSAPLFLAPLGLTLMAKDAQDRRWRLFVVTGLGALFWAILFLLLVKALQDPSTTQKMTDTWWAGSMAPWSLGILRWLPVAVLDFMAFIGTESLAIPLLLLVCAGLIQLWTTDRWPLACMLLGPAAAALLAACAHAYPFEGRLLLFMSGGVIVCIAIGFNAVLSIVKTKAYTVAGLALGAMVLLPITAQGLKQAKSGNDVDPVPAIMEHIAADRRIDDSIYVHALAIPVWRVYSNRYPKLADAGSHVTLGRDSRVNIAYLFDDLQNLQGHGRTWLLFSRGDAPDGRMDRLVAEHVAKLRGKLLETFTDATSVGFLVDFNAAGIHDLAPSKLPPYHPIHSSYAIDRPAVHLR